LRLESIHVWRYEKKRSFTSLDKHIMMTSRNEEVYANEKEKNEETEKEAS